MVNCNKLDHSNLVKYGNAIYIFFEKKKKKWFIIFFKSTYNY